jgi:HlyD family secretion protein
MRQLLVLLALLLPACTGGSERPTFQGYVEGEFIEVAPEVSGRIAELRIGRGDQVDAGALLFRIDAAEAEEEVARAEAELARAEAQLTNLRAGQRPAEIAVIDASIAGAQASLDAARRDLARQEALFQRGIVAQARLDQAREAAAVAQARFLEAERRRDVASLPARNAEIEAAERSVAAAGAVLSQVRARLADYAVSAPAEGRIEDIFYEEGEVASAGSPVLSVLPEDRRKVVFFVPEPARPALPVGSRVAVSCDGCPDGLTAEVRFLASEPEYTPPVIFSRGTREKLVFRAEAALAGEAAELPLGQPVDVTPADIEVAAGAAP